MEEINRAVEYYPDRYVQLINDFNADYARLPRLMQDAPKISDEDKQLFLRRLGL